MYGNFAGRDASRGMAKQSFEEGTSSSILSLLLPANSSSLTRMLMFRSDMLTPIDKPLDALSDLTLSEM